MMAETEKNGIYAALAQVQKELKAPKDAFTMAVQHLGFAVPPRLLGHGVGFIGVPCPINHDSPLGHGQGGRRAELGLAGTGIVVRPSHDTVIIRGDDAVKPPVGRGHVRERGAAVCVANDLWRSLRGGSGSGQGRGGQGQGERQGEAQADFLISTHFD